MASTSGPLDADTISGTAVSAALAEGAYLISVGL
jgi:hypothetical protein